MLEIIKGAGLLIYPLGLCSLIAGYIIFERLFGLRKTAVLPDALVDAILEGKAIAPHQQSIMEGRPSLPGQNSVMGRIVSYADTHRDDPEAVKAFARLQINHMERGIPYLDVIYVAAPLLGLIGTVTGLLRVFGQISPETGLPDPVAFTKGVSLALSATVIGLFVALFALIPAGFLQRKIENYAAKIDLLLERLLARKS